MQIQTLGEFWRSKVEDFRGITLKATLLVDLMMEVVVWFGVRGRFEVSFRLRVPIKVLVGVRDTVEVAFRGGVTGMFVVEARVWTAPRVVAWNQIPNKHSIYFN